MKTYIFLSTVGVGGAEKRFTCLFLYLKNVLRADVNLVLDRRTYDKLIAQPDTSDLACADGHLHIYDLGEGSFFDYSSAVNSFLALQTPPFCAHFPLQVPFISRKNRPERTLVSWVATSLPVFANSSLKLICGAWFGLASADTIDVLNPQVYSRLRLLPWFRNKLHRTVGGTFVDATVYKPSKKLDEIVFLGRLEREKQALRLAQCLPELCSLLDRAGHYGVNFKIIGDGSQALQIEDELAKPAYEGISIQIGYADSPAEVLSSASIFLSLQRTSNYPSKSLAEALACGAYPIITKAGDTDQMLQGCPHYSYIPVDFSPVDLFKAITQFLCKSHDVKMTISRENSIFASERFAIDPQARYFFNLYHGA